MPRYKLRRDLVKRMLLTDPVWGKTCLEFGYGSGDMLLLFASLGLCAFGFDISKTALDNARLRIEQHPALEGRIRLAENKTELCGRRYDYIMAFEVLEHVEDDLSCIREWWNLLNESGKLIISVPAHQSKWGGNDVATGHYRRYERAGMRDLLACGGFKITCFWNYAYPLSILLDVFLQKRTLDESEKGLSREELTKQSGIRRKRNIFTRLASSDFFLAPFLVLQRFFLEKDLSSAFLVVAERLPRSGMSR
ncbi:MAG TPA: class I SAM-dependent methyltransferase [Syntrophobacteraceae bacterium]|nr:class I SAM-dependent methyltransferase [Syntrophobacteraceae bacterium]